MREREPVARTSVANASLSPSIARSIICWSIVTVRIQRSLCYAGLRNRHCTSAGAPAGSVQRVRSTTDDLSSVQPQYELLDVTPEVRRVVAALEHGEHGQAQAGDSLPYLVIRFSRQAERRKRV